MNEITSSQDRFRSGTSSASILLITGLVLTVAFCLVTWPNFRHINIQQFSGLASNNENSLVSRRSRLTLSKRSNWELYQQTNLANFCFSSNESDFPKMQSSNRSTHPANAFASGCSIFLEPAPLRRSESRSNITGKFVAKHQCQCRY
jgi:hypothetical protein